MERHITICGCLLVILTTWNCIYAQTETPQLEGKTLQVSFELYLMETTTTQPLPTTTAIDETLTTTGSSQSKTTPVNTGTGTATDPPANTASTTVASSTDEQGGSAGSTVTPGTSLDLTSTDSDGVSGTESTSLAESTNTLASGADFVGDGIMWEQALVTMVTGPATVFPDDVIQQVNDWLTPIFENLTVGFLSLDITPPMQRTDYSGTPINYDVIFNISALSDAGLLSEAGLIADLNAVKQAVVDDTDQIFGPDELVVDKSSTEQKMTSSINNVNSTALADMCLLTGYGVCDIINNTCNHNRTTGTIACTNKCVVFHEKSNPKCQAPDTNLKNIYLKGKCTIDQHGVAKCDCGHSPGKVMKNFYMGSRCVSAAFVVGMAAGLGGGLIIIFMGAMIGLAVRKRRSKEPAIDAFQDQSKNYGRKDGFVLDDIDKSQPPRSNDYTTFTNQGFEGYQEPMDRPGGAEFRANLSHIDPNADYTIIRPSLRRNSDGHGTNGKPVYEGVYEYESARL